MKEEFYSRPILHVDSVTASKDYYCGSLGFEVVWEYAEEEPIIAEVARNGLHIILDSESVLPKAARPSVLSLSLHPPKTLTELHEEFQNSGARIVKSPFEVVWEKNTWQMDVQDLDGNILVFWNDAEK